ncbi:MAG: methyltransferase, partial [Betaproteobacteria bacterium]
MPNSTPQSGSDLASATPEIHWIESGTECSARWRSERTGSPPKRIVLTNDTITADTAYRLACEGTALLWRGDFHNATQLMQAMARRADKTPARKQRKAPKDVSVPAASGEAFHQYRQAQSQRARILGSLLIPFNADYSIALGRAPDAREACAEAWGSVEVAAGPSVASLRELQGLIGAHEWRKKGVEIPALGSAPDNRIHPYYGVFSPVRGEYVSMVATAPLPETGQAKLV